MSVGPDPASIDQQATEGSGWIGATGEPGCEAQGAAEWQPGDPLYVEQPARGHCLNAGCGATWTPAGATRCPECGGLAGEAAVFGEPLCVLTEDNDLEAFAALPDCAPCGGMGKWSTDDIEALARDLALRMNPLVQVPYRSSHDTRRLQSLVGRGSATWESVERQYPEVRRMMAELRAGLSGGSVSGGDLGV